jgi:gliding motility-associated-like protein
LKRALFFLLLAASYSGYARLIPVSDFMVERRCFHDTAVFTDLSCCNIDQWYWDFGDIWSGAANYAYTRTAKHFYSAPGTYTVKLVVYSGGAPMDTITKEVIICSGKSPVLNIHDTTICSGKRLALYSLNTFERYRWNTGDTIRVIYVDTSGTYILWGNDCDCVLPDTARIKFLPLPVPALGQYTVECGGDSMLLSAKNPGYRYLWNTGDTTQMIWAKKEGIYKVRIYGGACELTDSTIVVFSDRYKLDISKDTVACEGDTLYLNPGWQFPQVWWDADTNHVLKVFKNGFFNLHLHYFYCDFDIPFKVTFVKPEALNLGKDTVLCEGDTLLLDANVNASKYKWSNGDSTRTTKIFSASKVWLRASFSGCYQYDTVNVDFTPEIIPVTNQKKYVCLSEGKASVDVITPANINFAWWDGNTNKHRNFTDAGWHKYTISNRCFSVSDSVYNGYYETAPGEVQQAVSTCFEDGETVTLTGKPSLTYRWKPGNGSNRDFSPQSYGWYTLERTDSNSCVIVDSFQVTAACKSDTLFIPNVFSPNNDKKNETFKPSYVRHSFYEMRIFNRWGEELFMTNDYENGWDGYYEGAPCQEDIYIYYIEVSGYGKFRQLKGTVELVR